MSNISDRYAFVIRCKDCDKEMTLSDGQASAHLGAPVSSKLEIDGQVTRSINKRMVMLWVPDVCPSCSNLRSIGRRD